VCQPVRSASLVFRLRRFDHITDALAVLHLLSLPQWVNYKVAVCLCRIWISWFALLICLVVIVCTHPHHTVYSFQHIVFLIGWHSLSVAESILWNRLPPDIQSSASLTDHFLTSCCNCPHIDIAFRDSVITSEPTVILSTLKIMI